MELTSLLARLAMIRSERWTVVIAVSSSFQISEGKILFVLTQMTGFQNNCTTLYLLKLIALAKDVACGLLNDKVGCLREKFNNFNQFLPAIFGRPGRR